MRIFLSYGHDANEVLVRRIKADLELRGHDVWFDHSEIKAGLDWRRTIADGLITSDGVLSFLSKHSVRDPRVYLDEIGIAVGVKGGNVQTILVESESNVSPLSQSYPSNCSVCESVRTSKTAGHIGSRRFGKVGVDGESCS